MTGRAVVLAWLVFQCTGILSTVAKESLFDSFAVYLQEEAQRSLGLQLHYRLFDRNQTRIEIPAGTDTEQPFPLHTVSIPLTSLLLAALDSQGLLNLDQALYRQHPRFRTASPQHTETITLRHLLLMTSGIVAHADTLLPQNNHRPEDALTLFRQVHFAASPQQVLLPNLLSVAVAAYFAAEIVHDDSQLSLNQRFLALFNQWLAQPLQLQNTFIPADSTDPLAPARAFWSTETDLQLLLQMELRGGLSANNQRILSLPHILQRQEQIKLPHSSETANLGWQQQYHRENAFYIAAVITEEQTLSIGFVPAAGYGWVCRIDSGDKKARLLAEEITLSTVEMIVQLSRDAAVNREGKVDLGQ